MEFKRKRRHDVMRSLQSEVGKYCPNYVRIVREFVERKVGNPKGIVKRPVRVDTWTDGQGRVV